MSGSCKHQKRCGLLLLRLLYIFLNKIYIKKKIKKKTTLFQLAKNKHLPMKNVRYEKRKHKKSKWMTTGILKTDTNTDDYNVAKANFKRYRESCAIV